MNTPNFLIGEAAELTNCTVKAIRYYDEINLVKPSSHTEGGHRLYNQTDIEALKLISTLRFLDFNLPDIQNILKDETLIEPAITQQIKLLENKITVIKSRLNILNSAVNSHKLETPISLIQQMVESLNESSLNRNEYVLSKLDEFHAKIAYPEAWVNNYSTLFNNYLDESKFTPEQVILWQELQNLLQDPEYIEDFEKSQEPHKKIINNLSIDSTIWLSKLTSLQQELFNLNATGVPPEDQTVQKIIEEVGLLFVDAYDPKLTDTKKIIAHFNHMTHSETPKIKRFHQLCLQLNPEWIAITESEEFTLTAMASYLKNQTNSELNSI